jgi:uncharacterized protein YdaU (DUF1376 family)
MPRDDRYPFIKLWVNDFLADPVVQQMDTVAVGAFFLLLLKAWFESKPGTLPVDDDTLRIAARMQIRADDDQKTRERKDAAWELCWKQVKPAFRPSKDGTRWEQKRLMREHRDAVKAHKKRAAAGRSGGNAKKQSCSNATPMLKQSESQQQPEPESQSKPPPTPANGHSVSDGGGGLIATARSELEAIGVNGSSLRKSLAVPGLTAAHVALLVRQKRNSPRVKSVPAVVLSVLTDPEYSPPPVLTPADVEQLGQRVVRIGDKPVTGLPQRKLDERTRRDFLYWFRMNGADVETIRVEPDELLADKIELRKAGTQ